MSEADIEALTQGYALRDAITTAVRAEINEAIKNPHSRPITEFLATLIAAEVVEVKLAFRSTSPGIFHDKLGIFKDDDGNIVSFVGSANETFSAWNPAINHENFEVFQSWLGEFHRERIARHTEEFEELWKDETAGIRTIDFPAVAKADLLAYANPIGVDEAAKNVRHLVGRPEWIDQVDRTAVSSGGPRVLQEHQLAVVESWKVAGNRGIIDHVTGAGKTVSALQIVQDWSENGDPVLILVPTELLVDQWTRELAIAMRDREYGLLRVGAGSGREQWAPLLPDYTRNNRGLGARVVVATLASAATPEFLGRIQQGTHLLVVADEVHRAGSAGYRRLLGLAAGGRLGLSATPERYGDPEGSAAIKSFFGDVLQPKFGIPEAIEAGRLVPYDYYVHECELDEDEQTAWDALTDQIQKEYARLAVDKNGERAHTERFRLLLIRRARITKSAKSKIEVGAAVLLRNFNEGERWLAYCDNTKQVSLLLERLLDAGMPAYEYHSAMEGSRDETLEYFIRQGGILVAIKCLDEGVDIPTLDRAVILASSSNAREFIQRRGRVLRKSPGKFSARIHDLLVVPRKSDSAELDRTRKSILRTELRRAALFAKYARNKAVATELEILAKENEVENLDLASETEEEDESA